MTKIIVVFITSMNGKRIINIFFRMILSNYRWFNKVICTNNTLFLWYITAYSIYFTRFSCIYITPRAIRCTNIKNLLCNSTCLKTKNLGTRKWIFLIPQMTITISDVFDFPYIFINIRGTILVIKVSILSTKSLE